MSLAVAMYLALYPCEGSVTPCIDYKGTGHGGGIQEHWRGGSCGLFVCKALEDAMKTQGLQESHKGPLEGETAIVVGDDINGHRILFGYAKSWDMEKGVVLRRARCAIRYTPTSMGELGLGALGPADDCRITPAVESFELHGKLTYVMRCTPQAIEAWEKGPWR